MASLLRLASRERSSFLFKKSGQQDSSNLEDGSDAYNADNEQLPSISHIDTTSLANLFDRFQSSSQSPEDDDLQASTNARDFAWPVGSGMRSAHLVQCQTSPITKPTRSMSTDEALANMARNDSTGSSSLSRRSDNTPPMTRQSSSSSIMLSGSPLGAAKAKSRNQSLTALPQLSKADSESGSPVRLDRQNRASTWGSTNSSGSQPPNLDKPLPVGPPHYAYKPSNSAARLKSRRGDSQDHAATSHSGKDTAQSLTRFESLRKHTRSTTVSFPLSSRQPGTEHYPSSPPISRGARLGRAVAHANYGVQGRSKSEDLLQGDRIAKKKSHRASEPIDLSKKRLSLQRKSSKPLTARTAEQVIYRIMSSLENPKDLQSTAMISRGFFNTYQRNESKLVSHLIFKSSRPAWELRRSIVTLMGSKSFKLRDYEKDLKTVQALKALILDQWQTSCKAKTIAGLQGQDKQCEREVDNALWRVWTFCALFGSKASQHPVPAAELDWLNGSNGTKSRVMGAGFAIGNGEGLTVDELEDMSEIWCCLQNLISRFHGRESEAQRTGVLDNWHQHGGLAANEHIGEWIAYLLTLGPQVILSLSSGSFDRAKILGLTQWTPPPQGQTRSGFLMTAISHVYQERLLSEATAKAALISLPTKHRPTKSLPSAQTPAAPPVRQPSLRINTQVDVQKRRPTSTSAAAVPADAQEIRPDCDPRHDLPKTAHPHPGHIRSASTSAVPILFPASPTADPTIYHTLNLVAPANTASVRLGATLFPMEYTPTTPRVPFLSTPPPPSRAPPAIPGLPSIIDPIDKAMDLLVKELGFKEANAKRALAMCDSGSGIDVERAIELLMLESRREAMASAAPIELPTPSDIVSPLSTSLPASRAGTFRTTRRKSKKDYCDGGCKRPVTGSGASFASTRGSVVKSPSTREQASANGNAASEEEETGNISPITDIYGGHSDDEIQTHSAVLDDDSSEMWRRREGNDTISPLVPATVRFNNITRLSTQSRKAWKVLGVQQQGQSPPPEERGNGGSLRGGLARMRSKSSSSVVGMEEYALRVERRKSLRMIKEAERRSSVGLGVVSVGIGEQLKGLGLMGGAREERMSGGLGGNRVVEGFGGKDVAVVSVQSQSDGEGLKRRESKWLGRRRTSKGVSGMSGDRCLPVTPCN